MPYFYAGQEMGFEWMQKGAKSEILNLRIGLESGSPS
jgi:hypothetical protein